jgi:dTDP-4-amino-4,6-dideoxygalactose transaminase
MKKIRMVDLYSQYLNIKDEINWAMQTVIEESTFIKGRDVSLFEQELAIYHGIKHVVGCANGTDALQISLMALDLKPGDEVISPDFTFVSTVEVSALLGLKPVLVDVDPQTFTIDISALRKAITKKTKAIIPVHLFGQCANMEDILAVANSNKLFVIEDNAQAIGAEYRFSNGTVKKSGAMGNIGCTSFFPSKNLGCFGDGGAVMTDDDQLAEKIRAVANHGMKLKYHNDLFGVNSRLDTLQAAILRIKLRQLDSYIEARQHAAQIYERELVGLSQIQVPVRSTYSTHVFHQYTLLLNDQVDRDDLQKYLKEKGIPTMIYYPVPMHKQKAYDVYDYLDTDFPVTNEISKRVLSLPMHTELEDEQLEFIIGSIKKYFNG